MPSSNGMPRFLAEADAPRERRCRAPERHSRPRPELRATARRRCSCGLRRPTCRRRSSPAARNRRARRCRGAAAPSRTAGRSGCPLPLTTTSSPGSTSRMKRGADHVERDGLGGEDRRFAELAHDQRPDAERIAAGDQPFLGQDEQRIGAFDLLQRVDQPVDRAGGLRGRDEVDDDLGVAGRLEDRAAAVERPAKLHGVGQIAVVGDREAAVGQLGEQRLDVAQRGLAGGRIADVADGGAAGEPAHDVVAVEIAGDMAHRPVRVEMRAVEAGDARRLPGRGAAARAGRARRSSRHCRRPRCRKSRTPRAACPHRGVRTDWSSALSPASAARRVI